MVIRLICGFVLLAGWALAIERGEEMRLWAKGAPGSEGETAPEVFQAGANPKLPVRFTVVHYPSIYVFLPAKEKANGMADPAGPGSRAGSDLPHLHRVSGSVSGFAPDAASVGPTVPTSSAARSIAAGRADPSRRFAQGEIGMARIACGKNGNTADPSSHGHSSPHPVASTGLGGFALRAADRQDPVCSGVLDLEKSLKLEKEYPFSFVDLRVRDPPIGRIKLSHL